MSMIKEFQEFIARGNVVDLAVGVVIGGAFGNIVNSLVKDVITPPIGYLTSGIDFSSLKITIKEAVNTTDHPPVLVHPEIAITYGNFLNAVISFIIVAFVIFLVVKGINLLKRKEEAKASAPSGPTPEQVLLTEIRDILKSKPL